MAAFAGWAVGRWIISDLDGVTLAHELAHKNGVPQHAPCGNPANVDPNYPDFPSFSALPAASIGEVGFDSSTMQALDPLTTRDLMSYCSPRWISPYNYRKVFDQLTPLPPPAPPPSGFDRPDRSVFVSFARIRDEWVIVDLPGFARPVPPRPPPRHSAYEVIARDDAGSIVARSPAVSVTHEVPIDGVGELLEAEVPWHRARRLARARAEPPRAGTARDRTPADARRGVPVGGRPGSAAWPGFVSSRPELQRRRGCAALHPGRRHNVDRSRVVHANRLVRGRHARRRHRAGVLARGSGHRRLPHCRCEVGGLPAHGRGDPDPGMGVSAARPAGRTHRARRDREWGRGALLGDLVDLRSRRRDRARCPAVDCAQARAPPHRGAQRRTVPATGLGGRRHRLITRRASRQP